MWAIDLISAEIWIAIQNCGNVRDLIDKLFQHSWFLSYNDSVLFLKLLIQLYLFMDNWIKNEPHSVLSAISVVRNSTYFKVWKNTQKFLYYYYFLFFLSWIQQNLQDRNLRWILLYVVKVYINISCLFESRNNKRAGKKISRKTGEKMQRDPKWLCAQHMFQCWMRVQKD